MLRRIISEYDLVFYLLLSLLFQLLLRNRKILVSLKRNSYRYSFSLEVMIIRNEYENKHDSNFTIKKLKGKVF